MTTKLIIGHLYPDLLDLYSDRGNVMILEKRARWRGIDADVIRVDAGDDVDLRDCDLVVMGGGMDREQSLVARDLQRRRTNFEQATAEGTVVLAICGGYQLLGEYFETGAGERIPGIGLLDVYTVAGERRMVGNVMAECILDGRTETIFGYENHSGRTYLREGTEPWMRVVRGEGNNGRDGTEGARKGRVFGTYLHGPLLAKNPRLADRLLGLALERRGAEKLRALADRWEEAAREHLARRLAELEGMESPHVGTGGAKK
ncbi:CobB/CobQ domain protein glutamine amidotransferase [Kyrpidia tusciae DSM 2912]|uniref:Lipid II isoglutaminyl synthase (glutamine-hydrolyzing) subunit GatD n=1 Tax=Kyrpidia tusciae (strain DSM 2912 / NBRC 15312 / T2) TaxID=562970 RepID=D5WQJ9_KYRT2|nr:CobB/CobQ domain protein glutamine amidotransferase [Kyrpidia tusciae DSM 2912]